MKQKLLLAIFALLLLSLNTSAQKGYIYVHNKHINESNTPNYTISITGGPTSISNFILNDDSTYVTLGDIGASHNANTGTTGNGELWAIGYTTRTIGTSVINVKNSIYHRSATSSQWTLAIAKPGTDSIVAVDGAGPNACVYATEGGDVYYYNGTTSFRIFRGSNSTPTTDLGTALDVTYGYTSGKTAILSSDGYIYYFTGSYAANIAAGNTGWYRQNNTASGLNAGTRIDFNYAGTSIAYIIPTGTAAIKTFTPNSVGNQTGSNTANGSATTTTNITYSGTTVNGSTSTVISSASPTDIAYDDNGIIYCVANVQVIPCGGIGSAFNSNAILRYNGSSFTEEGEGRGLVRITGSAAGQMWGVNDYGFANTIWTRATDNLGAHVWLDDERVRTSVTNGNSIMIPVDAGTYTLSETIPSGYDFGRANIYDPSNTSDTSTNTKAYPASGTVRIKVASGEVVHIELFNELLVPKSIDLTCTTQTLQTFASGTSSGQFGTGTYGTAVEGTAYHYVSTPEPQDGDYFLVKYLSPTGNTTSNSKHNWYNGGDSIADHTTNSTTGGYFMLVNASYGKDEFYRQRVTNLVPGLKYTISFYVANALSCNPIKPNINYGLQDANGDIADSSSTGDISTGGSWQKVEFTFTASTSTGDLYLRNNNIGGLGNDLCLDDISLNPVIEPLPDIQVSPTIKPNVCIGTPYKFTNTKSGGIWTTSSSTIAGINPKTGDAFGNSAGTAVITYTYTNQVGCVSTKTTGIIVSSPPSAISVSDLNEGFTCNGQADSLFSTATGGTAPLAYSWSGYPGFVQHGLSAADSVKQNAKITPTATVDADYSYISLVTDSVGCTIADTLTIHVSSKTAPTLALTSPSVCLGSASTLTATLTGGNQSSPTYTWSTTGGATAGLGSTSANPSSATPTAAGTYTYKMKAFSGYCNVIKTTTVTAYANPSVSVSPPTGSTINLCKNTTTGVVGSIPLTSTPSGGSGTYSTFAWSTTGGAAAGLGTTNTQNTTASPTTSGTYAYSLTVSDLNGGNKTCTATATTSITIVIKNIIVNPPTLTITSPTGTPSVCAGQSVSLTATATGLGALTYSYQWTGSGTITNSTSLTTASAVPTATGAYVLTATDVTPVTGTGCTVSAVTPVVTVKAVPSVTLNKFATAQCSANSVDTLYAAASGGTGSYTYAWTTTAVPLGGSVTIADNTNDTTAVNTFNGDGTYTFQVVVTNAGVVGNTCTASGTTDIDYKYSTGPSISAMKAAASLCVGQSISFSPTVSAGLTYTQATGPIAGSGTSGGTNAANAQDNNLSTNFRSGASPKWIGLDLGSTKVIRYVAVYPVSGQISSLSGFTVETASNSTFTTNLTTIGTFSGSLPASLQWITLTISSNTARQYVRLRGNAASDLYVAEVKFYTATTPSISSYAWTATPAGNGLTTPTVQNAGATPTSAGSYTYNLNVTDANGCENTANTGAQKVFSALSVTALADNPGFCSTTGSVNLFSTPSGGSGTTASNNTYAWTYTDNGPGTNTFSSSTAQNPTATIASAVLGNTFTYTVTVTDSIGCTASDATNAIVVSKSPTITAAATLAGTACVGQTINLTGTVTVASTSPYSYAWTPPSNSVVSAPTTTQTSATTNTTTATVTASGNFAWGLLVIDDNNCTSSANTGVIAITDTPKVSVALGTLPTTICKTPASSALNLTGSVTTGTTSPYTYSWTGSGVTNTNALTTTFIPTTSGKYSFTATDAKGCKGIAYTTTVSVDEALPTLDYICGTNGSGVNYAQLKEVSGSAKAWTWTNNSNAKFYVSNSLSILNDSFTSHLQNPFVTFRGKYYLTITDLNNCQGSDSITVAQTTSCNVVLTVALTNFTAKKQTGSVLLNWTTSQEINNDHFVVERSGDGINWEPIGTVPGHINSTDPHTYSFIDNAPLSGMDYYRLKQVDIDHHFVYSDIRSVEFSALWAVHLYPNPASNFLILEFTNTAEEKGFITIETAQGSRVFTKEQVIGKGYNKIRLNQVQPLAQGTYFITLSTGKNIYKAKFVKGNK